MAKKVSLKDIAQTIGVSTALVSYVLNNQKENRISKEVAKRIREVAQELDYRPNQIAKSLKTNRTRTLGLIVADIANPFSAALARTIEDEVDQHNYTVIFGSSDENAQKCQKLITTLLNRQVDGLLIAAPEGAESQIVQLQQQGVPLVLIDRYFPNVKTSYVALDNYQAMYSAVQQLIDSGYQRIGLVTLKTPLFHIQERSRGYQTALHSNRLTTKKSWIKEVNRSHIATDVAKAVQDLMHASVDAIVFASNTLTLAGLKQVKLLKKLVPEEVALVGFDETDAYDLLDTPLTYIRQPIKDMGKLATKILLETLTTKNQITQANLEATLVIQASTQPIATSLPR